MSCSLKLTTLESTLQQSLSDCKDLMKCFEELSLESEDYKKRYQMQKEKCERKSCSGSEALKKVIESKETIIQLVASALTKLNETKNLNLISEAFRILCGETIYASKNEPNCKEIKEETVVPKMEVLSPVYDFASPEMDAIKQNAPLKDESVSEIEGTPTTGRISPIIQSRKIRNGLSNNSSDFRDKKKCPTDWSTPESKMVKLIYPSPSKGKSNGRLKQSRLNLVRVKINNVVDITSSPELMTRNSKNDNSPFCMQPLVKKESTDNDDTILPSPTSGPTHLPSLLKNSSKNSPMKFKRPQLCLKSKSEEKSKMDVNVENSPFKDATNGLKNEESVSLMKPARFIKTLDEGSPIKMQPMDEDETHCELPSSCSILKQVDALEKEDIKITNARKPLAENKNIVNIDSSMSLLRPDLKLGKTSPPDKLKSPILNVRADDPNADTSISLLPQEHKDGKISPIKEKPAKKKPECIEPVYKEVVPRKKAEKRVLPGWSCDECKNFYAELYKNDPDMLAKKMDECSKHRGKKNPARPPTPGGFWNPRWTVPDDTEEFNKRNNAI